MTTEQKTGLMNRLLTNRNFLWRLLFIILAITTLVPFQLPLKITTPTTRTFEALNKLGPQNKVVFSFDFTGGDLAECIPIADIMVEHLIQKKAKVVYTAFTNVDQTTLGNIVFEHTNAYSRMKYGEDFVWLGFQPGGEILIAKLGEDWSSIQVDVRGTPKSQLPLLNGINKITDFDTVIVISTQDPQPHAIMRQWVQRYNMLNVYGASSSHGAMSYYRYYEMGVLRGYVVALKGAAEYELLMKTPGLASKRMNVISISQFALVAMLALAGIAAVHDKVSKKEKVR